MTAIGRGAFRLAGHRLQIPRPRLLEVALLLPMAMPAYVCGYAYTWLLDVAGPVQTALRDDTGLRWGQYWFPEIRSLPGAALMLAMVLYPYVYLLCRSAFQQQSVCLIEASRTLGHSLTDCFFRLALPMARPAIVGGVALALMETLADFGTVQHFAVRTFTTGHLRGLVRPRRPRRRQPACRLPDGGGGAAAGAGARSRAAAGASTRPPIASRRARPVPLHGWKAARRCRPAPCRWRSASWCRPAPLLALMLQVGDPLSPARFLPFARNSMLLAALAAGLAVLLAGFSPGRRGCSPRPAQRAGAADRRAWLCDPRLGHRGRHAGAARPVRQCAGWLDAGASGRSRPGCCCRAGCRAGLRLSGALPRGGALGGGIRPGPGQALLRHAARVLGASPGAAVCGSSCRWPAAACSPPSC